jgi:hypothetical protein
MAHTYEELKGKTLVELRDLAKTVPHDAVQGYSQMNKDHLLPALCHALGIEMHAHHESHGIDKPAIKTKMRELKMQRMAALESHDHEALKNLRRQLHHLNRKIKAHLN